MTITYAWSFPKFEVMPSLDGLTDVVKRIHWTLTGTDADGNSASESGVANLGKPDGDSFLAFDDLTEEQVIEWVCGTMVLDGVKRQVEEKLVMPVEKPAPFATT